MYVYNLPGSLSSSNHPSTLKTRLTFSFPFFFEAIAENLFGILLGLDEDMMRRIEFGEEKGLRDERFRRKGDVEV